MVSIDRRKFLVTTSAATAATLAAGTPSPAPARSVGPVFLSTWEWGIAANARAAQVLAAGGSLIDAVEKASTSSRTIPASIRSATAGFPTRRVRWSSTPASWTERPPCRIGLQSAQDQEPDLGRPAGDGEDAAHDDGRRGRVAVCNRDGIPADAASDAAQSRGMVEVEERSEPPKRSGSTETITTRSAWSASTEPDTSSRAARRAAWPGRFRGASPIRRWSAAATTPTMPRARPPRPATAT